MEVNRKILEIARVARGLHQKELADLVGVTQGKISKYENGMLGVAEEDLRKIARSLRYPTSLFHRTDEVHGFGSLCIYHRKQKGLSASELERIHAVINLLRIHVIPLMRGAAIDPPNSFPYMDVDNYDGGPEEVAIRTRAAWGMPMGPVKSVLHAFEDAGGIVVRCSLGTQKLDAVSMLPPGQAPFVFTNADMTSGDRLRFTIAHEIGHMVMKNFTSQDPETEANRFAAEFLMPANEIKRDLVGLTLAKAAILKSHWKTSMQSIIRRARTLDAISERRYRSLNIEINEQGYKTREPVSIPPELPTTLPELIDIHFNDCRYSISEICKIMDISDEDFRATFLMTGKNPNLKIVG